MLENNGRNCQERREDVLAVREAEEKITESAGLGNGQR